MWLTSFTVVFLCMRWDSRAVVSAFASKCQKETKSKTKVKSNIITLAQTILFLEWLHMVCVLPLNPGSTLKASNWSMHLHAICRFPPLSKSNQLSGIPLFIIKITNNNHWWEINCVGCCIRSIYGIVTLLWTEHSLEATRIQVSCFFCPSFRLPFLMSYELFVNINCSQSKCMDMYRVYLSS